MSSSSLRIDAFTVSRGSTPVAGPVSLAIGAGEIVALVGRNGSGKTSFLSGLAGVLPNRGSLAVMRTDLSGTSPARRLLAGLALCPSGRRLFNDMTVHENVLLGGYSASPVIARTRMAALEQKELFRLISERRRQRAGTLSGGQQQIVAFARTLMSDPKVLLLDEPTAGLAPDARENVAAIMRDFSATGDHAILVAEENLEFASAISNRIVAFMGGRVLFDTGPGHSLGPAEILEKLLEGEKGAALQKEVFDA